MTNQTALKRVRPLIDLRTAQTKPRLRLIPGQKDKFEQQTLDLDFRLPLTEPSLHAVPVVASNRKVDATFINTDEEDDGLFDHQPTSAADLPPAALWSRGFAQALAEVFYGKRPQRQVARNATPRVRANLARVVSAAAFTNRTTRTSRSDRVSVIRVRVDEPADGVAHVAAVVESRDRCRALSFRLEGWNGRWICTSATLL